MHDIEALVVLVTHGCAGNSKKSLWLVVDECQ